MTDDPLLTGAQVAARLGINSGTWRAYVSRGHAPPPDDPDDDRPPNRRMPHWRTSTIDQWQQQRRGQGWRGEDAQPAGP